VSTLFRHIPAVDQTLSALCADQSGAGGAFRAAPRPLLKELVNAFLDLLREEIRALSRHSSGS